VLTGRVARAAVELDRVMRLSERIRLSMLTQLFARFSDNSIERLDEVCRIGTGSTPKRGDPRYYNKGTVPWVTSGVVNQRIVNEPTELITDTALKETNCKVFPAGSLIVALYGEGKTRGKVARLAIAAATNQALAALHSFDERIDPEWIALFLEARYQETREEAAGGVQPNLNLGIIKAIRLPVPALQEQRAAIQKMNNIFARADRLEAEAARARALLDRLETAILTKAFKGELVPQDPNEEPASVLFHRIKVARSQQAQSQPKRGRKASVPKTPREKAVMTKSRQDEDVKNKPYLANIIRQAGGSSEVEDLFKKADLPVTDFYKQLAWEVDQGHIHDHNNQTLRAA
jgi:type I restriction enzyme S subunit